MTGARDLAKAVLQAGHQLPEAQAHRWPQETSMDRRIPVGQVADAVVSGQLRPGPGTQLRETRSTEAGRAIRAAITGGTRPPGSRITVPDIPARHRLSRHSAKSLLRRLEGEQILTRQPGTGYSVTAAEPVTTIDTGPRPREHPTMTTRPGMPQDRPEHTGPPWGRVTGNRAADVTGGVVIQAGAIQGNVDIAAGSRDGCARAERLLQPYRHGLRPEQVARYLGYFHAAHDRSVALPSSGLLMGEDMS